MSLHGWIAGALGVLGAGTVAATTWSDPLASYYGNSLVCQNQKTHAVCHVWLNPDGSYYSFYDLGPQPEPAQINGPFQVEGREGRYSVTARSGVLEVCMRPQPPVLLAAQSAHELFSEAACYPIAHHDIGDKWVTHWKGAQYTLWLLERR
jgi:hypothetical protein